MRHSILTQKHWVIFLIFLVTILGTQLTIESISNIFNWEWNSKLKRVTAFIVTFPIQFSYPFLVAHQLTKNLKKHNKFKAISPTRIVMLTVVFIATYLVILISTTSGSVLYYTLGIVNLLCSLILLSIPARQLVSIELKRNAGFWEYITDTFLFLFWPIGVWWTQPRINKLASKDIAINE